MAGESIEQSHRDFINELENDLHGKKQGYVKILKIGKKIFNYSIPPQLEIVLLDPEDLTICFRPASDPDAIDKKKGTWQVGKVLDAVKYVIDWADGMKTSHN